MGIFEGATVVLIKVGGVAVLTATVEKGLELMQKEELATFVKIIGTVVVIYLSLTNVIPLFNEIGGKLLRPW